jgi:hypothetical protein
MSTTKTRPLTKLQETLLADIRNGWTLFTGHTGSAWVRKGDATASVSKATVSGLASRGLIRGDAGFPVCLWRLVEDRWFLIRPLAANEFKRLDLPWGVYSGTDERVTLNVKLVRRAFDRDGAEVELRSVATKRNLTEVSLGLYFGRV